MLLVAGCKLLVASCQLPVASLGTTATFGIYGVAATLHHDYSHHLRSPISCPSSPTECEPPSPSLGAWAAVSRGQLGRKGFG